MNITHLKPLLLFILFLFFASLFLHFLFIDKREGLVDQEKSDELEAIEDDMTPTMVKQMQDGIALESSRGYEQSSDVIRQAGESIDNVVTAQEQQNNSEEDNNSLNAISNSIDNQINDFEKKQKEAIPADGTPKQKKIPQTKESREKIIGIVKKFMA